MAVLTKGVAKGERGYPGLFIGSDLIPDELLSPDGFFDGDGKRYKKGFKSPEELVMSSITGEPILGNRFMDCEDAIINKIDSMEFGTDMSSITEEEEINYIEAADDQIGKIKKLAVEFHLFSSHEIGKTLKKSRKEFKRNLKLVGGIKQKNAKTHKNKTKHKKCKSVPKIFNGVYERNISDAFFSTEEIIDISNNIAFFGYCHRNNQANQAVAI